jgi:hypothetical protein
VRSNRPASLSGGIRFDSDCIRTYLRFMSECPVDQPTDEVLRPLPHPAGRSPLTPSGADYAAPGSGAGDAVAGRQSARSQDAQLGSEEALAGSEGARLGGSQDTWAGSQDARAGSQSARGQAGGSEDVVGGGEDVVSGSVMLRVWMRGVRSGSRGRVGGRSGCRCGPWRRGGDRPTARPGWGCCRGGAGWRRRMAGTGC